MTDGRVYDALAMDAVPLDDVFQNRVTPETIIELAHHNVHVAHIFCAFRRGDLSWEQMLMTCVVALARVNASLGKAIVRVTTEQPPAPVILPHGSNEGQQWHPANQSQPTKE